MLLDVECEPRFVLSKLLWDKRNDLLICFRIYISTQSFAPENLQHIYYLDSNLSPKHSIRNYGRDETNFCKLVLDSLVDGVLSYPINLVGDTLPPLEKMTYKELLKFDSMVKDNRFRTEKRDAIEEVDDWYR